MLRTTARRPPSGKASESCSVERASPTAPPLAPPRPGSALRRSRLTLTLTQTLARMSSNPDPDPNPKPDPDRNPNPNPNPNSNPNPNPALTRSRRSSGWLSPRRPPRAPAAPLPRPRCMRTRRPSNKKRALCSSVAAANPPPSTHVSQHPAVSSRCLFCCESLRGEHTVHSIYGMGQIVWMSCAGCGVLVTLTERRVYCDPIVWRDPPPPTAISPAGPRPTLECESSETERESNTGKPLLKTPNTPIGTLVVSGDADNFEIGIGSLGTWIVQDMQFA